MKYVFVGDIHGKSNLVEDALSKEGKKIFVGDFIDSFDKSIAEHRKCFELVLAAIKASEAEAIFGNHELSYLQSHQHRCSGFSAARRDLMQEFGDDVWELFKPYIFLQPNFLVSHAGLTNQLWEKYRLSLEKLPETLENWWPDLSSPMHQIGYYRGGMCNVGGMFWCDFNVEFKPVPGLKQVFGHTQRGGENGIRVAGENSYCIDCLDNVIRYLELDVTASS